MEDYIVALRSRDNTPAPLLNMDREHEEQMINNYKTEAEAKMKEKENKESTVQETKEIEEVETTTEVHLETDAPTTIPPQEVTTEDLEKTLKVEVHATAVHHEHHVEPKIAHAQAHDFSLNQGAYTVRRVQVSSNSSMYVIMLVAGAALVIAVVVGVTLARRRTSRYSHQQLVSKIGKTKDGFIEVDATSPEERHVAAMQINGYENPTYKYFEVPSA